MVELSGVVVLQEVVEHAGGVAVQEAEGAHAKDVVHREVESARCGHAEDLGRAVWRLACRRQGSSGCERRFECREANG